LVASGFFVSFGGGLWVPPFAMLVLPFSLWATRPVRGFPNMGISYFGKMVSPDIPCRNTTYGGRMQKTRYTQKYSRMLRALREARRDARLTQTDVAKRFGAHASFVSKCESGERRIDVVELGQFCHLYGLSVSEFLKTAGLD
jgi:DNA-binding XRE family transcriptional regulator